MRLAAVTAALTLAGCAPPLETDQARLCRMALPALLPPDAAPIVATQREDDDGRGVVVSFRAAPGAPIREEHCRFRRPGRPLHSNALVALTLDGRALDDTHLYFLIRFWLATPEGRAADPAPLGAVEALPRVPPRLAYALQQALDALPPTAIYALLASAFALIYGLVGRIHLAFGALAAAGGYGAAFGAALAFGAGPGWTLGLAGLASVWTALAWGLASGAALAPLRAASAQRTLVASVGLIVALGEALRLTQGERPSWVAPVFNAPFGLARAGDFIVTSSPDALVGAAVGLAASLALVATLKFSGFGRRWRAYADDPLAAALLGVGADAIFLQTFALGGALAGLAGFVATLFYGAVGYGAAATLALKALTAAVLGGIGSVPGALTGALLLGGFEAFWSATFSADYRDVASYGLLALTLTLRPAGLLGLLDDSPPRRS